MNINKAVAVVFGLAISVSVMASELGDLFATYQDSLDSGNQLEIARAAEAVYRYASKELPEVSKSRAAATLNYGKALIDANQFDEAEDRLRESFGLYKQIYGEEGFELVDPLLELARARAEDVGDSRRHLYRKFLNDALEIAEINHGKDSGTYAAILLEAGKIALDNGKDVRANRYLEEAYEMFSGLDRANIRDYFFSAFYLGKYHLARKDFEKAELYLSEALGVADNDDLPDGQAELIVRAFLVEAYEELGQTKKATEQCRLIGRATPFDMNQEPKPLFSRALKYPAVALERKQEGFVVARFTIDDEGFARDIEIEKVSGSNMFSRSAVEYLEEARYAPRFVDGVAVDTKERRMSFKFSMAD